MATLVCEVVLFMCLYIIYPSLLIRVYVKKRIKKKEKRKKNRLYVPLYHSSWGTCTYVTSYYIEYCM